MILSFRTEGTEDIFNGENTKAARRTCPHSLWKIAARKLDQLDSVTAIEELRIPPGNQLEALASDGKVNTAFESTNNIVSASCGPTPARSKLR
jgi:proteic killer suppression protein